MALVQLQSAVVAAVILFFPSRSAGSLPSCTNHVHVASSSSSSSSGLEHDDKHTLAHQKCSLTCLPASLPAALCIDPYLAKRIISHPTARDTRLDPTSGILSSECAPQGARGRPPCCRASIRPPPGLGPGLVGHFKRQSKLRHRSRNTTACFRSLRPGPFSKGDAAQTLAPAPYSIVNTQQPRRAPGLLFETAAVGWLMSWPVGRSNLAFAFPAA